MKSRWTKDHRPACCDVPVDETSYETREGPLLVTVSNYSHEGISWHVWDTENRQFVTLRSKPIAPGSRIRTKPTRVCFMANVLASGKTRTVTAAKRAALTAARRCAPSRMLPAPATPV
jgi:hypothetical protein